MSKKGPKQKTIKDKHGNRLVFHVKDKKINLSCNRLFGKLDHISKMSLTDAQVRGLRNWLNWYLDNK